MAEKISIIGKMQDINHRFSKVMIGERTQAFIETQAKLDDEGKTSVISEAQNILSHCISPGVNENRFCVNLGDKHPLQSLTIYLIINTLIKIIKL